jgi:hypothetical protein
MVEFHMCALYFLYLPGPDLGDAFLEAALQLLQLLERKVAHRITDQVPSHAERVILSKIKAVVSIIYVPQ